MLQNISLGVYYPGTSPMHRLQARTKLLVLFWLMVFLFVANQRRGHYLPYAVTLALLAAAVALSGVSPRELWRHMWLLILLGALGLVPFLLFFEGKTLLTLGPVVASYGLARAALVLYGAVAVAAAFWLALSRRRMRGGRWRRRLRMAAWLLALTLPLAVFTFWLLRAASAQATFPIGPVVVTHEGVWVIITLSTVVLVFYALALLLTMTTTPAALIEGLTRLLAPLRRVGLPVDEFALMALLALRFIPTLVAEADQLLKAQSARGADVTRGSLRARLQSLIAWFVPLVEGTLRRAAELATALDARGYEVQGRQTQLHEGALQRSDYAVLAAVVVITLASLIP